MRVSSGQVHRGTTRSRPAAAVAVVVLVTALLGSSAGTEVAVAAPGATAVDVDWASVVQGGDHSCGLRTDASAWCWGGNDAGQLGDGTTTDRLTPVPVAGHGSWASLSAGEGYTCGVRTDASAWCWGSGGALGDGSRGIDRLRPRRVAGGGTWTSVSAGVGHTCGVRTDASAWCWGSGYRGELGDGTSSHGRLRPRRVAGGGTWASVSAGGDFSCGIRTDASAWCWGSDSYGQVGDGTTATQRVRPRRVAGGGSWKSVSAGGQFACGLRTDGSAWCWGDNHDGELGDGTGQGRSAPVPVSGDRTWASVSAGVGQHVCGVQTDASAWCWGYNAYGQLGDGRTNTSGPPGETRPVQVADGGTWTDVSPGAYGTCGVKTDATAWCWGRDDRGQAGDGTTTFLWSRPVPVG